MRNNYESLSINVSSIFLDENNPRFINVKNQREAISIMIKDQGQKLITLARDIYTNGLNPSSKLIVFKQNNKYIDGDGNRRLTCIKLLETPSLADDFPKFKKSLTAILKENGNIPNKIDCVLFNSREEANHWIRINHSGIQDGKGQIPWNAEQKDRFEGQHSIGLQALDILLDKELITVEDKGKVNKTTLDRLLNYKNTKKRIDIVKKDEFFIFNNLKDLKKLVLNLRNRSVDIVYNAKKAEKFVEETLESENIESKIDREIGKDEIKSKDKEKDDNNVDFKKRQRARRKNEFDKPIFGGHLYLRYGNVNDLYRDIEEIYNYYINNRKKFSSNFVSILRMSLRLIVETASDECNLKINEYIENNFSLAKKSLNKDQKSLLSCHNIDAKSLTKLLHIGAHKYEAAKNYDQTLAMSLVIGRMLSLTHGKDDA